MTTNIPCCHEGRLRGATPSAWQRHTGSRLLARAAAPFGDSTPKAPTGSLAHTGADATPWLIGGAAVLIAAGGGVLLLARCNRTDRPTDDSTESCPALTHLSTAPSPRIPQLGIRGSVVHERARASIRCRSDRPLFAPRHDT
ncbi:LAETG motif-containing sortase-dependent surface protein [Streptomyces collinus]|uniref:LAETG motif-containing sortase-dependent surface protein n=1 Tax=Streptomyces collinus TaxID=42684 RepID=UPI0037956924